MHIVPMHKNCLLLIIMMNNMLIALRVCVMFLMKRVSMCMLLVLLTLLLVGCVCRWRQRREWAVMAPSRAPWEQRVDYTAIARRLPPANTPISNVCVCIYSILHIIFTFLQIFFVKRHMKNRKDGILAHAMNTKKILQKYRQRRVAAMNRNIEEAGWRE
jgi:hypothetical protein